MSNGTIVQCIGAVVDIQFPRDNMPKIYEALVLADDAGGFAEKGLTLEVQQQLGDGVVRTIAMGSSDGLRRGMQESRHPLRNGAELHFLPFLGSGGISSRRGRTRARRR